MEAFDTIRFEVEFSAGVWTNITPDVIQNPTPKWNMGIMNNGPLDRVGDPEILTFGLKNGASNSGGLAGYYSPGHTNCRAGWRTGLNVHLYFTYDGRADPYYKYHGTIQPEGIVVEPGIYGPRTVAVTCGGFMWRADNHAIDLMALAENQTIESATALVIANMPVAPLATDYGTGVSTFPTTFDTGGSGATVGAEKTKLAISELGYIYTRGDRTGGQTLVVRGRDDLTGIANTNIPLSVGESGFLLLETGDYFLLETGDKLILDLVETPSFDNLMMKGMQVAHGKHFANRIRTNAYPRRIDAAATTVLWSLENAIEIPANTTKTGIRGTYRDPTGGSKSVKGKEMVTPVSGTDFVANSQADGGGSSQTASMSVTAEFGTSEVEYAIANTSGASIYTGGDAGTFQARGKGIYFYDIVTNVIDDEDSQVAKNYGVKELIIDMQYQDDPTVTEEFAEYTLNRLKTPYTTIERLPLFANEDTTSMNAFLTLEPGTRAEFIETLSGISGDYFIMGYDAEIVAGKYVIWYPVLVPASDMDFTLWENGYKQVTEGFTASVVDNLIFGVAGSSAISGGAAQLYTTTIANHTGVWQILSHSSNANSGESFIYGTTSYAISQGGMEVILYFSPQHANTTGRFGVSAAATFAANYIACFIDTSLSFKGEAKDAATTSTTGTSYTLVAGTWYQGRIHVNQAGTLVTFELRDESGILLWTDTVSTNIPTASTFPAIRITYNGTPSGQQSLGFVDYFAAGYIHD